MNKLIVVMLLGLNAALGGTAQATPLDDLRTAPVSMVEFGTFKLEVALNGIKDWPVPIEGVSVAYKIDPDQIEIVVAVKQASAQSSRTACAQTIGRVREFLYVGADGVASMGRSYISYYIWGSKRGSAREATLRAVDASTRLRVNVVGLGSCRAGLINAPITFDVAKPN